MLGRLIGRRTTCRARVVAAGVVLLLFAWAPAASATTTATNVDGTAAVATGGAGDDEITVTVFAAASAELPDTFHVEDLGGVTAGTGCIQAGPNLADCPVRGIARVHGGAGNDVITFSFMPGAAGIELLSLYGEEGNDTITGSDHPEAEIGGGPGDDFIDGGGGRDFIDCGDGNDASVPDANDAGQINCETAGSAGTPAVLGSLTQANGVLSAAWTLPAGTDSWALEVGASPDRDSFGFLDPVTFVDLSRSQTSATTEPLPPGTYYVHVVSTPSYDVCVNNPAHVLCILQLSNVLGVIVLTPGVSAVPPPPGPSPGPPLGVAAAADKAVSLGAVKASSSQDVDKLSITLDAGEAVKVKLSGSVSVPGGSTVYRFTTIKKSVGAGKAKLSPKLAKKARKVVKRALRRKRRLKAKLTLVVTDNAGNSQTKKYRVRLKP